MTIIFAALTSNKIAPLLLEAGPWDCCSYLFISLHMIRLFFSFLKYYTSSFCSFFSDFTTPAQYDYKVDQPNRPFLFRMRLVIVTCSPRPPVSVSFIRRCIGGVQYGSGTWWLCVLPLYPDGVFQFLKCSVAFFLPSSSQSLDPCGALAETCHT